MIDSPASAVALLLVGLVGYLVGSISSGYIVGRIYRNVDLRNVGSGSTGATNTFRTLGTGAAAVNPGAPPPLPPGDPPVAGGVASGAAAAAEAPGPRAAKPAAAQAGRRRFRFRWRLFAVIVGMILVANEAQVMSAAGELKSALPGLPRGESEAVWKRYRQLGSRSLLGIGMLGLAGSVKDWFVAAADELIADYRSDTPVIRENGWREAASLLGHAASMAPRDRAIRARLLYCRGQLARFKVPKDVIFLDALPRNPSGKVLKRELRQQG